jgi:hypothetical protein
MITPLYCALSPTAVQEVVAGQETAATAATLFGTVSFDQVVPPSVVVVVAGVSPLKPTATHVVVEAQEMPVMRLTGGTVPMTHVVPPSVVLIPPAWQVDTEGQDMLLTCPKPWLTQVTPPSFVVYIPSTDAAAQNVVDGQETLEREAEVEGPTRRTAWSTQVLPPSAVARTSPVPTATQ